MSMRAPITASTMTQRRVTMRRQPSWPGNEPWTFSISTCAGELVSDNSHSTGGARAPAQSDQELHFILRDGQVVTVAAFERVEWIFPSNVSNLRRHVNTARAKLQ